LLFRQSICNSEVLSIGSALRLWKSLNSPTENAVSQQVNRQPAKEGY